MLICTRPKINTNIFYMYYCTHSRRTCILHAASYKPSLTRVISFTVNYRLYAHIDIPIRFNYDFFIFFIFIFIFFYKIMEGQRLFVFHRDHNEHAYYIRIIIKMRFTYCLQPKPILLVCSPCHVRCPTQQTSWLKILQRTPRLSSLKN